MNSDEFLKEVAQSFIRTPIETLIFISVILGILVFIISFNIIRRIINRNTLTLAVNKKFEKYIVKYSLTKLELDLVNRMSHFLKNPLKKYLILANPHTFNNCFHLLSNQTEEDKQIQVSLYKKLGFNRIDPNKIPNSSDDIAEGTPAKIISKDEKSIIKGLVTRQLPDAIVFESLDRLIDFSTDAAVLLIVHNYTGLYGFKNRILKAENKTMYAAHSEDIVRTQHREYFRKKIYLPILLRREGSISPVR